MERKLYIKTTCMTCRGKAIGCFYCDANGQNYIEASDKTLKLWFESLEEERKIEIKSIFCNEKKDK